MNPESDSPAAAPAPEFDASMHDMLRIMDVASALRRERETAEAQLDLVTAKRQLRERLLATAAAAGETVTEAEVDTAIDEYFRRQHRYEDPPAGWARFWAHIWVMRNSLLLALGVLLLVGTITALSVLALTGDEPPRVDRHPRQPGEPVQQPAPQPQVVSVPQPAPKSEGQLFDSEWLAFEASVATARATAADEAARTRVAQIAAAGDLARAGRQRGKLRTALRELDLLMQRLQEEYVVQVVSRPGEKSGIDRYYNGRFSGYYVIVEARRGDGTVVALPITSAETSRRQTVRKWGELVSEAVWQRLVADKKADGVIDENVFARKLSGHYDEQVVLADGSGGIVARGRQITQW